MFKRYLIGKFKKYLGKWKYEPEKECSVEIGTLKTEKYEELSDKVKEENEEVLNSFEDAFDLTNDIEDLIKNAEEIKETVENGNYSESSVQEYLKTRLKEKSELIKEAFGEEYSNLVNIFDNVADYIDENIHSKRRLTFSRPESPLISKEENVLETENLYSTNTVN